jgi:hypothetical protein
VVITHTDSFIPSFAFPISIWPRIWGLSYWFWKSKNDNLW